MTCWAAAGSPSDPPHSPAAALADFNCTTLYTWQYETAERSILLLTNKFNYHWLFGLCDVFLSSKYSSVCCSCKIIKLSYSFYDSIYYFLCCKTVPHNAKKHLHLRPILIIDRHLNGGLEFFFFLRGIVLISDSYNPLGREFANSYTDITWI